jgi:hypothetical protein
MKGVLGLCFSLSGAAALALEVLWMRSARLVLGASYSVAVGASILSCAAPPGPPPLPATARTIAVLPPNNRTGDPLLIESASFLHPDADRPGRITVADALATEARAQLARRGVKVIAPEAVTAAIGNQTPRSPERRRLIWQLVASSKVAPSTLRYGAGRLTCPPCIPDASL